MSQLKYLLASILGKARAVLCCGSYGSAFDRGFISDTTTDTTGKHYHLSAILLIRRSSEGC